MCGLLMRVVVRCYHDVCSLVFLGRKTWEFPKKAASIFLLH